MDEKGTVITVEDLLNGKYRYVEGQPVRRSYFDMENIGIENMKYKVGDKVKIKSLDWYNENKDETDDIECSNNIWFYREMSKFCGKVMTISHIRADHYTMVEDMVGYWTDEMIECKVEEECPQDFIEKYCRSCGTQRCDRTKEYLNGCPYYNAYMCKKEEETKPKPKFKVGDRIYPKYHKPSNDLEIIEVIRGDGHYGYRIKNHHTNGTYFMWEYEMCDYKLAEEETKSHNDMCKKLIEEMNPNLEVNVKVKTKPQLKFKTGDRVFNKVTRKWVNIIEFDIETGLYIVRYDDGLQGRSLESELRFMEEETDSKFKEIIKKKAEEYIKSKTELGSMSKSFLYEGFVDGMMTALKIMEE